MFRMYCTLILGLVTGGLVALPFLSADRRVHAEMCTCNAGDIECGGGSTDISSITEDTTGHASCGGEYTRPHYTQIRVTRGSSDCEESETAVTSVTAGVCGLESTCDPSPEDAKKCWKSSATPPAYHLHAFWFKLSANGPTDSFIVSVREPSTDSDVCATVQVNIPDDITVCNTSCTDTTLCAGG
jgi:hypothetical protein